MAYAASFSCESCDPRNVSCQGCNVCNYEFCDLCQQAQKAETAMPATPEIAQKVVACWSLERFNVPENEWWMIWMTVLMTGREFEDPSLDSDVEAVLLFHSFLFLTAWQWYFQCSSLCDMPCESVFGHSNLRNLRSTATGWISWMAMYLVGWALYQFYPMDPHSIGIWKGH